MQYLEDEARKGFIAVLIIASALLILTLVLSLVYDGTDYDHYNKVTASSQR